MTVANNSSVLRCGDNPALVRRGCGVAIYIRHEVTVAYGSSAHVALGSMLGLSALSNLV